MPKIALVCRKIFRAGIRLVRIRQLMGGLRFARPRWRSVDRRPASLPSTKKNWLGRTLQTPMISRRGEP